MSLAPFGHAGPATAPGAGAAPGPGAAPGTLDASRCQACGRLHAPARRWRCLGCGGRDLAPAQVHLVGTVESFTVPRGEPDADGYRAGLALVRLDAGPMVTAELRINGVPPAVGARVEGRVETPPGAARRIRFLLPAAPAAELPGPQPAARSSEVGP